MVKKKVLSIIGALAVAAGAATATHMKHERNEADATARLVADHIIATCKDAANWYQAKATFKGINGKVLAKHHLLNAIRDEGGMLLSKFGGRVTFGSDTYHTENDSIRVTLYQVPDAGCTYFIRRVQGHFSQITINDYVLKEHQHGLFIPSLKGACTTQSGIGTVTLEATRKQLLGKDSVIQAFRTSDK